MCSNRGDAILYLGMRFVGIAAVQHFVVPYVVTKTNTRYKNFARISL
jgi:hypothetical protein